MRVIGENDNNMVGRYSKPTEEEKGKKGDSKNSEVEAITADTARIEAEAKRKEAEWKLKAQKAGFMTTEDFKTGIAKLYKDRLDFDSEKTIWTTNCENQKKLDDSKCNEQEQAYKVKREELVRVDKELKMREANVVDREKAVSQREGRLDKIEQNEYLKQDEYNKLSSRLSRELKGVNNNFRKIGNCLILCGLDSVGDSFFSNADKLETWEINGSAEKILDGLKVMAEDAYNMTFTVSRMKTNRRVETIDNILDLLEQIITAFPEVKPKKLTEGLFDDLE